MNVWFLLDLNTAGKKTCVTVNDGKRDYFFALVLNKEIEGLLKGVDYSVGNEYGTLSLDHLECDFENNRIKVITKNMITTAYFETVRELTVQYLNGIMELVNQRLDENAVDFPEGPSLYDDGRFYLLFDEDEAEKEIDWYRVQVTGYSDPKESWELGEYGFLG
ncbi:MAG: hypothetical protein J5623_00290 [Clostridiales bacterium]|nr:hypothetical protein [Clostridiales bacterium]